MKHHTTLWFALAVAVASLTAPSAPGQIVWRNVSGGDFTNGANWVGGSVPTSSQQASFISNATYTVTFSSGFVTNNQAAFRATTGATVTFNLAGNPWNIAERVWIGDGAGNPNNHVVLTGGGAFNMYGSSSDLNIGVHGSGSSLTITGGVTASVGRFLLVGGQNAANGVGSSNLLRVTGVGSVLNALANGTFIGGTGNYNQVIIENGATANLSTLRIGSNNTAGTGDAGGSFNSVTVNGGTLNMSSFITVGRFGVGNSLLVTGGGFVTNTITSVGENGWGASLTIQSNSTYLVGDRLNIGTTAGSSNNLVAVTGAGSNLRLVGLNDIAVGFAGSSNTLQVLDGALARSSRDVYVGGGVSATASTNNSVLVSGANSRLLAAQNIYVGTVANSSGHRLVVENGGLVSNVVGQVGVAGSGHSALITGGGVWTNTSNFEIGLAGRDHSVTVSNGGRLVTGGSSSVRVGNGGSFNTLTVGPGGTVAASQHLYIGSAAASSNNTVLVSGAGATVRTLQFDVNVGNAGSFNSLVVSNGGQVIAARHVYAGTASAAHNSILVGQDGLLEARGSGGSAILQAGTAAGNTISNVGGVFQFTHATPTINNGGSPAKINITDGTVSFRGIANADVRVSAPGFAMDSTKMSWNGANTFMLNAASNTTASQTYTFQTGNPTNFTRLVMVNGHTAYRGGDITVGSGGSVHITNTTATISGLFTNAGGTVRVDNAHVTWQSRVVNNGAWITDPSTNVFLSDYTVLGSGSISMSAGDVFIFKSNFVNQSTQSNTYNTTAGKFLFDSGGGQTQKFFTAALDLGPGGIYPTLPGATNVLGGHLPTNNFVLGTLELSNFSTVMVTDAFVTDGKRAGLYLENLLMAPSSLLIISNNVSVYFINSNNWTFANIVLLGDAELHQLIPEPSTLLLLAAGGAVWVWWRRRGRGNG